MDPKTKANLYRVIHEIKRDDVNAAQVREDLAASLGYSEVLKTGLKLGGILQAETAPDFLTWLDTLDPVGQAFALKSIPRDGTLASFVHEWGKDWFARWTQDHREVAFGDAPPQE